MWNELQVQTICATSMAPPKSWTFASQRISNTANAPTIFDWILDRLSPVPGESLVDVGAGKGSYHGLLLERGVRLILAIDSSPAMVTVAQRQANESGYPVVAIEATAERLPVPDASYDLGMANYVLFHVDDIPAALRELRRVLKPSGRAVLSSPTRDSAARLHAIHCGAAAQLGYQPVGRVIERFNENHMDVVRDVFPRAKALVREDALVFPSAEAVLRYYATGMVDAIADPPADGSHRSKLLPLVFDEVEAVIAREGVFRDPKSTNCFVVSNA